jgi:hypothetical protein
MPVRMNILEKVKKALTVRLTHLPSNSVSNNVSVNSARTTHEARNTNNNNLSLSNRSGGTENETTNFVLVPNAFNANIQGNNRNRMEEYIRFVGNTINNSLASNPSPRSIEMASDPSYTIQLELYDALQIDMRNNLSTYASILDGIRLDGAYIDYEELKSTNKLKHLLKKMTQFDLVQRMDIDLFESISVKITQGNMAGECNFLEFLSGNCTLNPIAGTIGGKHRRSTKSKMKTKRSTLSKK